LLFCGKAGAQFFGCFRATGFDNIKHSSTIQIVKGGDILMAGPQALFIDAKVLYSFRRPAFYASLDGTAHDLVNWVPAEIEQGGNRLCAGTLLKKLDDKAFKHERKT